MDSYTKKIDSERRDELKRLVMISKITIIHRLGAEGIQIIRQDAIITQTCDYFATGIIDIFYDEVDYLYMLIKCIKGKELDELYDFLYSDTNSIRLLEKYGPIDLKKYRIMKNIVFTILRYYESIGKIDLEETHDVVFGRSLISMLKMFNIVSLKYIFYESMKNFLTTKDTKNRQFHDLFNVEEFPLMDECRETDPLKIKIRERAEKNVRYDVLEKVYGFTDKK